MPGIARRITMEYFDEEILEARRELERLKHTTLETGIYVGDELITFTNITHKRKFIYICRNSLLLCQTWLKI
jgi:hypothetical protein